jgi:hypothetical protein
MANQNRGIFLASRTRIGASNRKQYTGPCCKKRNIPRMNETWEIPERPNLLEKNIPKVIGRTDHKTASHNRWTQRGAALSSKKGIDCRIAMFANWMGGLRWVPKMDLAKIKEPLKNHVPSDQPTEKGSLLTRIKYATRLAPAAKNRIDAKRLNHRFFSRKTTRKPRLNRKANGRKRRSANQEGSE